MYNQVKFPAETHVMLTMLTKQFQNLDKSNDGNIYGDVLIQVMNIHCFGLTDGMNSIFLDPSNEVLTQAVNTEISKQTWLLVSCLKNEARK